MKFNFRQRSITMSRILFHQIINYKDILAKLGGGGEKAVKFKTTSAKILLYTTIFYAFLLLFGPKRYSARYLYNLPGDKSNASLSLEEIGTSSRDVGAAGYASSTYDPRENYKAIFLSDPVISKAKKLANAKKFPLPKISLKPNSTLISVIFTTNSFDLSLGYANTFNNAALARIAELRKVSISERREPIDELVSDIAKRLSQSQEALATFQYKNDLKSEKQIDDIIDIITELKQEQSKLNASIQKYNSELNYMLSTLDLNYGQVRDTLKLRNDKVLEEMLVKYAELTTQIKSKSPLLGINHPEQKLRLKKQDSIKDSIIRRANRITNKELDLESIEKLALMETRQLDNSLLLVDLIDKEVSLQGFKAEQEEISDQILSYTDELNALIKIKPQLADLQRSQSLSEAILAAALGNVEYSESNYFEGYPQIQIIEKPSPVYVHSNSRLVRLMLGYILTSMLSLVATWAYIYRDINWTKFTQTNE